MDKEAAREATIQRLVSENESDLCDRLSCLADTLTAAKQGYDAGYEARKTEDAERISNLTELVKEVMDDHKYPDSGFYNECDGEPCHWCELAQAALDAAKED